MTKKEFEDNRAASKKYADELYAQGITGEAAVAKFIEKIDAGELQYDPWPYPTE